MNCKSCHGLVKSSDGVKCSECQSRFHSRCASAGGALARDAGDRCYQWCCALCQRAVSNSPTKTSIAAADIAIHTNAINNIIDKFELVNKIQLPRINNEITLIKNTTEQILQQNGDILRKMEEMKAKASEGNVDGSVFRRRKVSEVYRAGSPERARILPAPPAARYRIRRRHHMLHKFILLLNRKLSRSRRRH